MITIWVVRLMALIVLTRGRVTSRLSASRPTAPGRAAPGGRDGRDDGAGMVEWLLIIGFVVVAFTGVAAVVTGLLTRLMGAVR